MLLLCTPLGFARLFTIVGDLVIKPTFSRYLSLLVDLKRNYNCNCFGGFRNLDEEYHAAKFEENSLKLKLATYEKAKNQRFVS